MKNLAIIKIRPLILIQRIFITVLIGLLSYVTLDAGIHGLRYFIEFPEGERIAYLLLPHIATGFIALIVGPWQFIPWVRKKYPILHRQLGKAYLLSVGVSSLLGLYLAIHRTNLLFRTGITGLALAWMVTALLAYLTIRKRLIPEHRDWMILNYVLTWAFVSFRQGAKYMSSIGFTPGETMIMAWLCWVPPLLIAGLILYLRQSTLLTRQTNPVIKQKYPMSVESFSLDKHPSN